MQHMEKLEKMKKKPTAIDKEKSLNYVKFDKPKTTFWGTVIEAFSNVCILQGTIYQLYFTKYMVATQYHYTKRCIDYTIWYCHCKNII